MEKITDEMIHEINELARKSKTVGLSEKEKKKTAGITPGIFAFV